MLHSLVLIRFIGAFAVLAMVACGPSGGNGGGADGGNNNGSDAGPSCSDGETRCLGQMFQTCSGSSWTDSATCVLPNICNSNLGCVQCNPNQNYCIDNDVFACDANGQQGGLVESCSGGLQCSGGACVDLCADAAANRSYLGCEYWAVDLDNAIEVMSLSDDLFGCLLAPSPDAVERNDLSVCTNGSATAGLCDPPSGTCPSGYNCEQASVCVLDAAGSPFAVVVSNPNNFTVDVTISNGAGTSQTVQVASGQVTKLLPQSMGFPDQSIDGSGISRNAYKVVSNAPIVAYQFNPLDNVGVFSNDGSLLIPRATFDTKYYALSWPTLTRRTPEPGTNDYNSYVSIVAWEDGTEIKLTPTADVRAGQGGSFSAITAGTEATFTLDAYDVLNIEAVADGDLSGTVIEANDAMGLDTFGVFGGHEAILIQNTSNSCCADHVEEMMFPASTWGDSYALARSESRGQSEPDVVRVMAQTDGTTVTFNPSPAMGSCGTLNAGQFCEVHINADTEITANNPILVGHYLMSVIVSDPFGGSMGEGDPSMALAVPTEQFRATYTFLVPSEYAKQFVSVVADAAATVTLDGNDVTSQLQSFGSGAYKAGRISVQPGQHKIDCPGGGCGIEVYGYSDAVSYLFAGGLDLDQIVID